MTVATLRDERTYLEYLNHLKKYVESMVSDKYKNLTILKNDGPGALYLSEWGPGNELRILKTDGLVGSARAKRNVVDKKLNVANEIRISTAIPDAEIFNIIPAIDYYDETPNGPAIIAMRYYQGARKLDDIVDEINKGTQTPFSKEEIEDLTYNLLRSIKHYADNGILHRDIKPSNVLVVRENSGGKRSLRAYLIDSANGCRIEDLVAKALPTVSGHFVTDPFLDSCMQGNEAAASEESELYSLGVTVRYAANGRYGWEIEDEYKIAKRIKADKTNFPIRRKIETKAKSKLGRFIAKNYEDESLLDSEGYLDPKRYERANKESLYSLPKNLRKYRDFLDRLNTLDRSQRFNSINEAFTEFNNLKDHETFSEKWTRKYKKMVPIILLGAALLGSGGYLGYNYVQNIKKPAMVLAFNGKNLELSNNFFDLSVTASSYIGEHTYHISDNGMLKVQRGNDISGVISVTMNPLNADIVNAEFPAAVYIEGYGRKRLNLLVNRHDRAMATGQEYDGYGPPVGYFQMPIPKTLSDGVHNMWVEVYSTKNNENDKFINNRCLKDVDIPLPGTTIARKRIELIVGDAKSNIYMSNLNINFMHQLFMENPENNQWGGMCSVEKGITSYLRIPETGLMDSTTSSGDINKSVLWFGNIRKHPGDFTLETYSKKNGKIINYNIFPLQETAYTNHNDEGDFTFPKTEIAPMDSTFYRKAIAFRKMLESDKYSK